AVLAMAGIAQLPAMIIMFACYSSLTVSGQDFLEFQWDSLLLEAGFLAIFLSPWQLWSRRQKPPSHIILWMLRWLVFRVMFMSGVVKLSSNDQAWRSWTALKYHYFTQPLPPWTAWYAAHFPERFQIFSCGMVFFFELIVPPLIFLPRTCRLIAFWAIIFFQLCIIATGNYGFFNLLTIVLCFTLPDDRFWSRLLRRRYSMLPKWTGPRWPWPVTVPLAAALLAITIPEFVDAFRTDVNWPQPLAQLQRWANPLRIANGYGLFAIMTTTRPELIIEGSDDGITWREYTFKWKLGPLNRAPPFTLPMMPRLDWQMWFAALGGPNDSPWLFAFMEKLAQGSPAVLKLMAGNPFPDRPPEFVRAVMYDYQFTTPRQRKQTGDWWTRENPQFFGQVSRD
ncbi:MAG TPA: lipase maturation factor family protein, partial [Tepidisphaeraceae bacterium]|nr:lipase maturation factor family protein [Tepidisphaeraceae bacterium]